jgi:hypothetical protein
MILLFAAIWKRLTTNFACPIASYLPILFSCLSRCRKFKIISQVIRYPPLYFNHVGFLLPGLSQLNFTTRIASLETRTA